MALALDNRKLLPAGVHESSLEEVEAHFGRFQRSDRRMTLLANLRDYVAAVKRASCGTSVIINDSFVMACVDEPEDIDLILVLPSDWDLAADLKPFQYNLVSKRRVKKQYSIEVFPVVPRSRDEQEMIAFFCQVNTKWCNRFGWPDDSAKGIVRVTI